MTALMNDEGLHCANCGARMHGEFCQDCGQSVRSVIRPMHGMLEDTLDIVLNVDGRVVLTLPPLLLRPGFLTLEYFSGRRVRYVAPFRLMFLLCVLAFFMGRLALDSHRITLSDDGERVKLQSEAFERAQSPAEVDRVLRTQQDQLQQAQRVPGVGAVAGRSLDQANKKLKRAAAHRRQELAHAEANRKAEPAGAAPAGAAARPTKAKAVADEPDDPATLLLDKPVRVSWLPAFANAWLTRASQHMRANIDAIDGDGKNPTEARERLMGQMFATLPQGMFLMLPVFALGLKLVYLFRRRLYMEHLIVALHSHAFLFLTLLLGLTFHLLAGWIPPHAAWLGAPLRWLQWALWIWAPIYLLLMQKRVYQQGWPMTVLKYVFIGWCYCWLLTIAVLFAALFALFN